ncbi:hypothetical protein LEMLEM_LOCUS11430 [Lemmus lemmus]
MSNQQRRRIMEGRFSEQAAENQKAPTPLEEQSPRLLCHCSGSP